MSEWYVGRKANFQLTWHESYRRLLRIIDARERGAAVRVVRRSKPIQDTGRGRGKHRRTRGSHEQGCSEWADKDYYIYLGIAAPTSSQAEQIGKDIFTEAERAYQVGFGDIFPPQGMDDRLSRFLIPTEFPSDGRIPAEPPREDEDIVGPFAFYDLPTLPPVAHTSDPRPFDRLLSWLSAAGEGRWESFVRVAKALGAAPDLPTARRLFRRFALLGHVESSPDGRTWSMAPPVLVKAATSPQTAFWCGSRGAALLKPLTTSFHQEPPAPQPDGFGPSRWSFRLPPGDAPVGLPGSAEPTWDTPTWGGAVAERLPRLLPDVQEWMKALDAVSVTPPDLAEQWQLQSCQFQPQPQFCRGGGGGWTGPAGLYRLTYGEAPRAFQLTVFFDPAAPPERQLLRGEWYGLRFLALRKAGKYLKAMWQNQDGGVLAVPYRQRWPLLYERALVLASGFLPCRHPENGLLYYQGVPRPLAETVAEHLGVQVEVASAAVEV
jgi:hypothetical protein